MKHGRLAVATRIGPCLCGDPECPSCGPLQGYDGDEDQYEEPTEDNITDVEADADTLASAGMGTDEDYGVFSDD